MINYKRLIISTVTGALLGIVCIIGVGLRIEGGYLDNIVYLLGIWMSRLVLGVTIGFVGEFVIIPGIGWKKWMNTSIRGIFFGLLFSVTVLLLDPHFSYITFAAGIAYGLIIDLMATFFTRKKVEREEKKD